MLVGFVDDRILDLLSAKLPTPDELRDRIELLRRNRGFLLSHHGAMAAGAPDLLEPYFQLYSALTLKERHLPNFEKEFVWMCILIVMKEAVGTHHLHLFTEAGGTPDHMTIATRLSALAIGSPAYEFMDRHWAADRFPDLAGTNAFVEALREAKRGSDLPASLLALSVAAAQAALGSHWGTAAAIEAAYAFGTPEEELVEALSLIMWPAGVNRFLDACEIWHGLMRDGRVTPSERFRIWAETPGQGGFSDRQASPC